MNDELQLHPIWKHAANRAVAEFDYGDMIPHEWLLRELEVDKPIGPVTAQRHQEIQFDLLAKMEAFRDEMLLTHRRYLVNQRGVGYRIVEPSAQTDAAMTRLVREMAKVMQDTGKALVNICETALDNDASRRNADARSKLAYLQMMTRKQIGKP